MFMPEIEKSGWITPELIVLERSKPEEAVLCPPPQQGCKVGYNGHPYCTSQGCKNGQWQQQCHTFKGHTYCFPVWVWTTPCSTKGS